MLVNTLELDSFIPVVGTPFPLCDLSVPQLIHLQNGDNSTA